MSKLIETLSQINQGSIIIYQEAIEHLTMRIWQPLLFTTYTDKLGISRVEDKTGTFGLRKKQLFLKKTTDLWTNIDSRRLQ